MPGKRRGLVSVSEAISNARIEASASGTHPVSFAPNGNGRSAERCRAGRLAVRANYKVSIAQKLALPVFILSDEVHELRMTTPEGYIT